MKPIPEALLAIAFAALLGGCDAPVSAQPRSDPAPMPAPTLTEDQRPVTVTGAVRAFTRAPTGEVDGFVMRDGTVVHFPTYLSKRVTAFVGTGGALRVMGVMTTGRDRDGQSVLEAQTISNLETNRTMRLSGAPPVDQGPAGAGAAPEERDGAEAAGPPVVR